jgi:hypothetical protein
MRRIVKLISALAVMAMMSLAMALPAFARGNVIAFRRYSLTISRRRSGASIAAYMSL